MNADKCVAALTAAYAVFSFVHIGWPNGATLNSLFAVGSFDVLVWPFSLNVYQACARGMLKPGASWPVFFASLAVFQGVGWWALYWFGEATASV